jgi:YVTN family beta-propeller protein
MMRFRRSPFVLLVAVATAAGTGCKDSTSILIPVGLEMTPSDTFVPQRGSVQLHVTVRDTAGNPIPVFPTFAVSDSSLVTVTSRGLVRSLGPIGTAIVEASLGPFQQYTVITVFDSSLGRVALAGRPYGAAIAPTGVAYVTLPGLGRLGRADLPSQTFTTPVTVGSIPTEVAFNSTGTRAYVTNQYSHNVGIVSVATNTQIDAIPVTGDPFEVIVAPGDSILYVSTNVDSVYGIRLATKAVVTAFATPAIANGFVIRDTLLYASTHGGGTVVEFNLRTRTVARTFAVGGTPQKLALSADGNELYIANEVGYVQFWNLVTGAQIGGNLALPPGSAGYGMARRPSTGQLYVTSAYFGGGNIHIIDPATRTLTRTIVAGADPRRVVFNASGTIGFVPNGGGWVDFLK